MLPLALLLCVQACLLFRALDLLPVWSDEAFTLKTVALPVHEIIPIVQRDIHPPLYFILLREWRKLPLPWTGIAALRAFSALWALVATLLLGLFWPRSRWLALSLFVLSPCFLPYSRMARSYSMQVALALLSLGLLQRWIRQPRSWLRGSCAAAALLALLYTHYLPGVAVIAAFGLVACRTLEPARMAAFALAVAAGYSPWIVSLLDAFRRWGTAGSFSSSYWLTGSPDLEQFLKLGFGLVSLTIGESFFAVSLLLVPVILLLAVLGLRTPAFPRRLTALLAVAAAIGYLGVARWVSYPFIPARLLWLLPFLTLAVALGIERLPRPAVRYAAVFIILLSYISSDILYFRRENFLNLGYSAPLAEIAATLNTKAQRNDLILLDSYNTDYQGLRTYLTGPAPVIVIDQTNRAAVRARILASRTVWIVRNTRDVSPGNVTTEAQSAACAGRSRRDTLLDPYAPWQQFGLSLAGIQPVPEYFYQLTECKPAE